MEIEWRNEGIVSVCNRSTSKWVTDYLTEDVYFMSYFLFRIVFVHLGPCCILVVLNLLLFRALRQAQARRAKLLSNKTSLSNECNKLRDSNCTTLMLIVVVSVFLVVEMPFAVVSTLHVLSSALVGEFLDYDVANVLVVFLNFFIILSYPINFAIYCGMSRQFRQTFSELFVKNSADNKSTDRMRNTKNELTTNGGARVGSSKYSFVNGPTKNGKDETLL